jgi:hypothetical protein
MPSPQQADTQRNHDGNEYVRLDPSFIHSSLAIIATSYTANGRILEVADAIL